jgi:hypothetical protein
MTDARKEKRERERMAEAAHDASQFTVTPFGRRRRRGTWGVIVTVMMLACMPAVRAFRRVLGWDSGA